MKLLDIKHHLDDYECMWNGIEDLYMNKTGEVIPNQFFFSMSGFCSFAYIKTSKADMKRMISFGDGRTKKMYEFLAPIVGFNYHHIECSSAIRALNRAKTEIDKGFPVVLGALDMFYLDYYPKLFHKYHIPFHYVLMIGYDDELEEVYLYDCGKKERVSLSYENILQAFNAEYPGLCKKNTICTIRMDMPNSKEYIAKTSLRKKADMFLHPATNFLGYRGMNKLVDELPNLEQEIGKEELKKIFRNMVEFMGSVPTIPKRLLGLNEEDSVCFKCSRDKMSKVLEELNFLEASKLFQESGLIFEKLCQALIDYILDISNDLLLASKLIKDISLLEYKAYELIRKEC